MKQFVTLLFLTMVWLGAAHAQTVVQVPSDLPPSEGNLNNAIQDAITNGTLSNTVFELEPYGYYILTGTIIVPEGQHLEIVAPAPGSDQNSAPPQILWTASGGVTTDFNFEVYGSIKLKNVWLRYATTAGTQVGSSLQIQNNPDPNVQERAEFEGVIFDYSPTPSNASGSVGVTADRFVGIFKNCYFRNCIDNHLRYYGRAVSFPFDAVGWHSDSLYFENCTFANMGYVHMQEGNMYTDNVYYNHCTFMNVVQFTLQSGWWYKMAVTNSVFVNTFMYGEIPAQTTNGEMNGGTVRIDSVAAFPFTPPFTDQDRRILFANNNYYIESWLENWMHDNPYSVFLRSQRRDDEVPIPMPMLSPGTQAFFDSQDFPFMNAANLYDDVDPVFSVSPTNQDSLMAFMHCKWDDNCDHNWAYAPDEGWFQTWPLSEDLSYSSTTLQTAAMGGFPLGDLYHWWPSRYADWSAQASAEKTRIMTWLETGNDPLGISEVPGGNIPA
ncbi:MAG: hypothetical protein KDI06_12430, partial [Calditrichaeota bacterium]|nr:hypothetical protein [Calditrichota bacterium]